MAIVFDSATRTITLQTRSSTYQMQINETNHVLHLYYGKRIDGDCLDYRFVLKDCGFSPNSYEERLRRDISLDILPQEYSASNCEDFRVPAIDCVSADGVWGSDLRYVSHSILPGKYSLEGLPAAFGSEDEAETLSVTLRDQVTGVEVELLYGVFEQADMITRAVVVKNGGERPVRLERVYSVCLDITFGDWELLHFYGQHCMERRPERLPLMRGIQTVASRRGASSHHHNPFVVLMEPAATETRGECIGVMPVYSGNHRTDIEVDQMNSVRLVSGINPDMFSWQLEPGERFVAPEVILCRTDGGLDDLSCHYHEFILRHVIRSPWKDRRRPVLINSWEAMTFDFTADKLLEFARDAASLGIEMMVLDDGWFGQRNSDNAGLGDWFANTDKLPGGVKALSDGVHALGMKFGLWIEPEMVNEDSDLYRAHPDWALTVPGRKPVLGRDQLVLDMGRAEVVEHLYRVFSDLIRNNGIDYIKWDMNRNMTDVYSRALPPDRQLEASHRYILGVYDLFDRLTDEFPEVLFEGCSGGGGRFDAGMLYYTPQIWCSDDTDAIERLTIQAGTSVGYPISAVGAHVSVCPNQQTGRSTSFGTRAVVAMSGTFGYELDPARLSEEERQQVVEQVQRFKRYYDLIQWGRYHRLSDWPERQNFTAWSFTSPDGSRALVNLVVTHPRANGNGAFIRLRGLVSEARYRLEEIHFEGCKAVLPGSVRLNEANLLNRVFTGAGLMYAGYTLPPMQGDFPSVQLLFTRIDDAEVL